MAGGHFFLELEPPEERLRDVPHVVIVGGGFAGIHACKALAKANVRITLIDKRNFNLFQPLLYQVSTGLVSRGDIATPLRELVGKQRNVQVLLGEVTNLYPEGKQIVFNGKTYSYDHLVLATGSGSTFFGHDDWRTFAPPMKILEHAEEIRRRLLMAMEQAEQTPDPSARQFLQTVVIVGAGPSGCEMAGAVSELMHWALNNAFKQLDPSKTRIVLVDPGDRVLRAMPAQQSEAALASLERDGIEFIAQSRVQTMRPGEVIIGTPDGDRRIQAATVIWTAGVRPSHLGSKLSEATGCALDKSGRVVVEHDFSIPEHPEIRVAGDLSNYSHTSNGKPMPGMAAPAKQAGTFIGKDIAAIVANRSRPTFNYFDFGSMAVLDRADISPFFLPHWKAGGETSCSVRMLSMRPTAMRDIEVGMIIFQAWLSSFTSGSLKTGRSPFTGAMSFTVGVGSPTLRNRACSSRRQRRMQESLIFDMKLADPRWGCRFQVAFGPPLSVYRFFGFPF